MKFKVKSGRTGGKVEEEWKSRGKKIGKVVKDEYSQE